MKKPNYATSMSLNDGSARLVSRRQIIMTSLFIIISNSAYAIDCTTESNAKDAVNCLQKQITALVSEKEASIPKGAVLGFNSGACPTGWKPFAAGKGRVIVGAGRGRGLSARIVSDLGGAEAHKISVNEMPAHRHSGTTAGGNPIYHRVIEPNNSGGSLNTLANHVTGWHAGPFVDHTDANYPVSGHTHNFSTTTQGAGAPHETMPPFIVLQYCEKN